MVSIPLLVIWEFRRRGYGVYRSRTWGIEERKRATSNPYACIFVPTQECNDVGSEREVKLQRNQTSGRKFAHPQYAIKTLPIERKYMGRYRRPEFLSKQVRATMEAALAGSIYRETSRTVHINIERCHCNDIVEHERGRDESTTAKKWRNVCGTNQILY